MTFLPTKQTSGSFIGQSIRATGDAAVAVAVSSRFAVLSAFRKGRGKIGRRKCLKHIDQYLGKA
jgi:hypothetical protein